MKFFMKKCQPCHIVFFNPEKHPYEPHPGLPLRHGLTKSGAIDWPFWRKQDTWTFDQGVRLLDITRPGGDTYCDFPWVFYGRISDGLKKAYNSSAAHHIFIGEPNTEYGFIRQWSVIWPQAFLEWAYYNDFAIPAGLEELLPDAIREELALDDIATMFSTEEPPEVPPSLPPDQVHLSQWTEIYQWYRDRAEDQVTTELWDIMLMRLDGLTNLQIHEAVYPQKAKQGMARGTSKAEISKKIIKCRKLLLKNNLPILPQFLPQKKG